MKAPTLDPTKVLEQIKALQRDPFREALADAMSCRPDTDSLIKFANKSPDRWAQMVSILAKAAGYHEKSGNETNLFIQINNMSDAQLEMKLQQVTSMLDKFEPLKSLKANAVDAEVVRKAERQD